LKDVESNLVKRNNEEFQTYWKTRNVELEDMERKEKEEIRQRNLLLRDFHKTQAIEKVVKDSSYPETTGEIDPGGDRRVTVDPPSAGE
jgi:hypothetical protein